MHISFVKKKKFVEWICGNGIAKIGGKKNLQLVCGNAIAEIGGKFCGNCGNAITENGRKKKIVVAEIWEGIKKKNATSKIFLQHFHNKSQVIIIISSNLNLTLRLFF